jgi:hypothetical protein
MTLFLLHTGQGYEGYDVLGVFTTRDKAELAMNNHQGCNDGYAIVEFEVDEEYDSLHFIGTD